MENIKITGLPVIVSVKYRIALDKKLCSLYKIPGDGLVRAKISRDSISVYPESFENPKAIIKQISVRRFNLPVFWAKQNSVKVGQYAFLIAADSCIIIHTTPWTLEQCRRNLIYGIPVKITPSRTIYIPKTIWLHYGIEPDYGFVTRKELCGRLIFRKYDPTSDFMPIAVKHRSIPITQKWMKENSLKKSSKMWLYGINNGIVLSVNPACNENFENI